MTSKFVTWLDERLGLQGIYDTVFDRKVPKVNWWFTLGSASLFLFVMQGLTGIFLTVYYVPSPDAAYDSIQYIMNGVAFGWLIRGIHHWGASLMVMVVFIHLLRVFVTASYKYPRELTWLIVLDLETFYPAKDRSDLALRLNGLLASPGFTAWTQGEPLDVQRLLWTPAGMPRLSVLSIAHLGDAERMFFVTKLLNEVDAWMRAQRGTSSLRAILYMDEVFGYFPPTANPPSKTPMLTLLKQARAFGLGCVLSTQNPVDLDYKGLSNAGTWFLGRLQTERDKMRVIEGLEGGIGKSSGRLIGTFLYSIRLILL